MKIEISLLKHSVIVIFFVAFFIFIFPVNHGSVKAQKPPTLKQYSDDRQLCNATGLSVNQSVKYQIPEDEAKVISEYCENWKNYQNTTDTTLKNSYRDNLIEIVRGQVDDYYFRHKNGRRVKVQWLQMILDILEIGMATTIDFINGERAKSVLAAVLTGFKGGRTSLNKNFEILQLQVLINKMNTDRERILTGIYRRANDDADFTWLKAKSELRNYFFAGTFGNAMDSLVEETGDAAKSAKEQRINEEKRAGIQQAPSQAMIEIAKQNLQKISAIMSKSDEEFTKLQKQIDDEKAKQNPDPTVIKAAQDKQQEIRNKLQALFGLIEGDPVLQPLLEEIPEKFSNNPNSKLVLEESLQKLKDNSPRAVVRDYDLIITKVGRIAVEKVDAAPSINQRFQKILDTFK